MCLLAVETRTRTRVRRPVAVQGPRCGAAPRGSRTEGGSPMRFESAISESPRTLKHTFAATTVAVAVESVRRVLRERRRQ